MQKRLVTAADIRKASRSGQKSLLVPTDECIVTPMARDEAETLGVLLDENPKPSSAPCEQSACPPETNSDELANAVSEQIKTKGVSSVPANQLEAFVRQVVLSKFGLAAAPDSPDKAASAVASDHGLRIINAERLLKESEGLSGVSEKMFVAGAIGDKTGEKLAGGYLVWDGSTFNRVVEEPEIAVVIEGELHLLVEGDTMVGRAGDMIYLPKGANVDYHAPGKVKLACVNLVGPKQN
jgi:ethanolamine utilization protein EutQ